MPRFMSFRKWGDSGMSWPPTRMANSAMIRAQAPRISPKTSIPANSLQSISTIFPIADTASATTGLFANRLV